jgi:hypothetical protein
MKTSPQGEVLKFNVLRVNLKFFENEIKKDFMTLYFIKIFIYFMKTNSL